MEPRNLTTAWYGLLRRSGIRKLGFHTLRHTAVSLLIAREQLNPKQLSAMIGHASIQLTYDTYGHLMPDAYEGFGGSVDTLLDHEAGEVAPGSRGHAGVTPAGVERATTLGA